MSYIYTQPEAFPEAPPETPPEAVAYSLSQSARRPQQKITYLGFVECGVVVLLYKVAILQEDHYRHAAIGQRKEFYGMQVSVRKGEALTAVIEKGNSHRILISVGLHEKNRNLIGRKGMPADDAGHFGSAVPAMIA